MEAIESAARLAQRRPWARPDDAGDRRELRDENERRHPHGERRQHTFDAVAHLQIIDVSCPQQMLAIMRWIMEGNRGLLYVRVMRTPSAVLYPADYTFEFGKGSFVHGTADADAFIVSSGRGVHEAHRRRARVRRARCAGRRRRHAVDRRGPADGAVIGSGKPVCIAEQNNGYILQKLLKMLFQRRHQAGAIGVDGDRHQHAGCRWAAAVHSLGHVRGTDRRVRPDARSIAAAVTGALNR